MIDLTKEEIESFNQEVQELSNSLLDLLLKSKQSPSITVSALERVLGDVLCAIENEEIAKAVNEALNETVIRLIDEYYKNKKSDFKGDGVGED